MLGCNYPNNDNLLKTSILSQPPNTQCPPEGSLAYCIVIAKFLHVVLPLGNGSGRYSPFLGWRDGLSHGAKKKSVKNRWLCCYQWRGSKQPEEKSRTFTMGVFFSPKFPILKSWCLKKPTAHLMVWIFKVRSLHRQCPHCCIKMN